MECVKNNKKKYLKTRFVEINTFINNIDLFEKYLLRNENFILKDQLFSKNPPPFDLVSKILKNVINKDLTDNIHFEFSRQNLKNKDIIHKIDLFLPELKSYYLKCKHSKYLENLNEKKIITLFRQILRPYDFSISAIEKYNDGKKYLLYILEKKKNLSLKKIESTINFD